MSEVRIGCSGWNYAHWRERIYPNAYYNNDWDGYAVRDGLRLRELLGL